MKDNRWALQNEATMDDATKIGAGMVPGVFSVYKFGRTILQGSGKFVPMTDLDGNYIFPETAEFVTPTSSVPASDIDQGVGALNVYMEGLDADKKKVFEVCKLGDQRGSSRLLLL